MKISDINKATKTSFHGNFGKVVLGMLVYLAFFAVIQVLQQAAIVHPFFSFVLAICVIVVSVPIGYGLTYMLINVKDGKPVTPFDFFTLGFANFGRAWKMAGGLIVKLLAPMLLMLAAIFMLGFGIGLTVGSYAINPTTKTVIYDKTYKAPTVTIHSPVEFTKDYDEDLDGFVTDIARQSLSGVQSGLAAGGVALIIIGTIGIIACGVWGMIVSLTYALTSIIAIKEEELNCWDALKKSKELMNGNKWKVFVLSLPVAIATGFANSFMTAAMRPYNPVIVACNIVGGIVFYAAAILILVPLFQMQTINVCYMANNEKNPKKETKVVEAKAKSKATKTVATKKTTTKKATPAKKTTTKKTTTKKTTKK